MNELGFRGLPWSIGRVAAAVFCFPMMVAGSRERADGARTLAGVAGARSISGPERIRRRKLPGMFSSGPCTVSSNTAVAVVVVTRISSGS